MAEPRRWGDARLSSLPFPLRNITSTEQCDPEEILKNKDFFGNGTHFNQSQASAPLAEIARISIGQQELLAIRTTPLITCEEGGDFFTMAIAVSADQYRYKQGGSSQDLVPGDIHLDPRTGGTTYVGYFSGFIIAADHMRLARTMRAMKGGDVNWNLKKSYILHGGRSSDACINHGQFWALFTFLDQLLCESKYLAKGLGLDDQIYRLLALSLFQTEGSLDKVRKRWELGTKNWTGPMDDLVDYIAQNVHTSITLTDLEEQSNYSGRHLQNLFKEKFDCTPMQFVRRQRLTAAMEKLQTAEDGENVTSIARDCGYRFTSNFTTDFQREFGVNPSVVLRSSRGGVEDSYKD
jgi:AraC-like DNA-binding protein